MSWREHGGNSDQAAAHFGHDANNMLDLSTGISPRAYPTADVTAQSWNQLPSHSQLDTCLAAARRAYEVPEKLGIMAGAGTQSLLQFIPSLLPCGGIVWIDEPTYNEHRPAWEAAGHQVITGDANLGKAQSAVIVAPNNPTGKFVHDAIMATAKQTAATGGIMLIDGAFAMPAAADPAASDLLGALVAFPHVVHIRSFGKFFGMAGLRLGFAIGAAVHMDQLQRCVGPWAVSSVALDIGNTALNDTVWQAQHSQFLRQQTEQLQMVLTRANLKILGGTTLFQTVKTSRANHLHDHLAKAAIWTRKFSQMPDLLRFGVPANEADFARLSESLNNWRHKANQ